MAGLLPIFVDDLVYTVHARPHAPSMLGDGLGKIQFAHRLEALLDAVEVVDFALHDSVWTDGFWYWSRVGYRYRHRGNGLMIEGTMRHKWGFVGKRIAHFEVFHDADRMRAFFDMRTACA